MNLTKLTDTLDNLKDFIVKHIIVISVLIIVSLFSFMVIRIYLFSIAEPSQEQIEEKLTSYKPIKLDPQVVSLFRSLQDQNISIESLFDNGRTNTFQ